VPSTSSIVTDCTQFKLNTDTESVTYITIPDDSSTSSGDFDHSF